MEIWILFFFTHNLLYRNIINSNLKIISILGEILFKPLNSKISNDEKISISIQDLDRVYLKL